MTKKTTDRSKGILSLVLLALVFASMGLFVRFLSIDLLLFQQVYFRVGAAFVFSLLFFYKSLDFSKLTQIGSKDWTIIFVRSISFYVIGVTLFTQAIILTKYSNVTFIGALPMVAILGFILLKEKVTLVKILLILLAFIGVVLVAVTDYSNLLSWGRGEILALISTFFFSLSYIARKWQSDKLNNKEITAIIFFVSFWLLLGASLFKGDGIPSPNWNVLLVLAIIGAGIFNILNLFLTNYGFEKVNSVLASNILTLESVFAVILGFIFFKEIPNAKELIGGVMILVSVVLMNRIETEKT